MFRELFFVCVRCPGVYSFRTLFCLHFLFFFCCSQSVQKFSCEFKSIIVHVYIRFFSVCVCIIFSVIYGPVLRMIHKLVYVWCYPHGRRNNFVCDAHAERPFQTVRFFFVATFRIMRPLNLVLWEWVSLCMSYALPARQTNWMCKYLAFICFSWEKFAEEMLWVQTLLTEVMCAFENAIP